MRRVISVIAIAACASIYAYAAARATFILTDGERKGGVLVAHGGSAENLINGQLNLGDNGREQSYPLDQVAVIDLVGGQPAQAELAKIPPSGQAVVTRDGGVNVGQFVNIVRGDTLLWKNGAGQQQQYSLNDVARIYLNTQSARTAFNYTGTGTQTPAAVGTAGAAATGQEKTFQVDARQWIDTGITVNAGDKVAFKASGEITFGRSAGQTAGPDGNPAARSAQYPVPNVPAGALIGRVGNGKPFGIGTQTQALPMPNAGRLFLGVNDNETSDNSGAFTVVVTKQ